MICHGGSNPTAIMNAVRMAREYVAKQVNDKMVQELQQNFQSITDPPATVVG